MNLPEEFDNKMNEVYAIIIDLFVESYNKRRGDMLEMSVEEADDIFTEIIETIFGDEDVCAKFKDVFRMMFEEALYTALEEKQDK